MLLGELSAGKGGLNRQAKNQRKTTLARSSQRQTIIMAQMYTEAVTINARVASKRSLCLSAKELLIH